MENQKTNNCETRSNQVSVAVLADRLKTAGPTAWEAFAVLGQIPTKEALDVLIEYTTHKHWSYRLSAIMALSHHPMSSEIVNILRQSFNDPSPYVVRMACEIVGQLELRELHGQVLELLSDRDPLNRLKSVGSIEHVWSDDDFSIVFQLMNNDIDPEVRKSAAMLLFKKANNHTWRMLADIWVNDDQHHHRVWACELIGKFGRNEDCERLRPLLNDKDGHVRKAAMRNLEQH